MKNKLSCKLLILGLVVSSVATFSPAKTYASVVTPSSQLVTIEPGTISPMTAYNWWVYNLGVSAFGVSQIVGPMSGGSFNTEGPLGSNRTFTITWSGASSNSNFYVRAIGMDSGNAGMSTYSERCLGSSGSTTFTIPLSSKGIINLYIESYTSTAINIGSLQVDSR